MPRKRDLSTRGAKAVASSGRVFPPRAPRHIERLTFTASLPPAAAPGEVETAGTIKLIGHTKNISASGLALILPSQRFAEYYMTGNHQPFPITLDLPSGSISMSVAPVRFELLSEQDLGMGYLLTGLDESRTNLITNRRGENDPDDRACLVGVQIVALSSDDRARYLEFLDILEAQRAIANVQAGPEYGASHKRRRPRLA